MKLLEKLEEVNVLNIFFNFIILNIIALDFLEVITALHPPEVLRASRNEGLFLSPSPSSPSYLCRLINPWCTHTLYSHTPEYSLCKSSFN